MVCQSPSVSSINPANSLTNYQNDGERFDPRKNEYNYEIQLASTGHSQDKVSLVIRVRIGVMDRFNVSTQLSSCSHVASCTRVAADQCNASEPETDLSSCCTGEHHMQSLGVRSLISREITFPVQVTVLVVHTELMTSTQLDDHWIRQNFQQTFSRLSSQATRCIGIDVRSRRVLLLYSSITTIVRSLSQLSSLLSKFRVILFYSQCYLVQTQTVPCHPARQFSQVFTCSLEQEK